MLRIRAPKSLRQCSVAARFFGKDEARFLSWKERKFGWWANFYLGDCIGVLDQPVVIREQVLTAGFHGAG